MGLSLKNNKNKQNSTKSFPLKHNINTKTKKNIKIKYKKKLDKSLQSFT